MLIKKAEASDFDIGEKVMTLVQIHSDTKQNDIASGVTVVQYGNKNNVGIKMDNHCPICHAVLPNGNTFCKNCDIDINDANKNQQKQNATGGNSSCRKGYKPKALANLSVAAFIRPISDRT